MGTKAHIPRLIVLLVAVVALANIAMALQQGNWHSLLGWITAFWFGVIFYLSENELRQRRAAVDQRVWGYADIKRTMCVDARGADPDAAARLEASMQRLRDSK